MTEDTNVEISISTENKTVSIKSRPHVVTVITTWKLVDPEKESMKGWQIMVNEKKMPGLNIYTSSKEMVGLHLFYFDKLRPLLEELFTEPYKPVGEARIEKAIEQLERQNND